MTGRPTSPWWAPAAIALSFLGPAAPRGASAIEVTLDGRTYTLPSGFVIEKIAGPPLVERPIVVDFDERGRLYVADSSGSNDPVPKQLEEKPHRILRLEDTDGDGVFDRRTVYADKFMFPEGAMWLDGSLYVSAPPSIWKLTDTDDDGVADRREEWFQGKTLTGCANDLHGPYLGRDGWIYWCKGAFAKQTYEREGKPPFVTRASHIFRCRPDGSGLEPVMTGGMDNPVDVVFTPGGERIFTTTFLQHPGGGRRDGLIHAIYGGVYGKVHDVIEDHPRTAPNVMPVLAHLGPAAPCGLATYESKVFGDGYKDNLFACCFNLQKVTRHVLEPDGSTFKTRDEDFLVSPDRDFHPTDVQEDADGSLVVVDTGGWYKLCCPTSQLWKPDLLGGIYRVRRLMAPKINDPRGLRLHWAGMAPLELPRLLDDPRPAVRRRAIQALARWGEDSDLVIERMARSSVSPEARRNAIWAATRTNTPRSLSAIVRAMMTDDDATVRLAAANAASLLRDPSAKSGFQSKLTDPSPSVRRAAAEGLGRIGDGFDVRLLLNAAARAEDRGEEHSITYALIEIGDPGVTAEGLEAASPATRRAALVALDQMPNGNLSPGTVVEFLTSSDPALRETAAWIAGRHPDWGGALAGFFRDRLEAKDAPPAEKEALAPQIARFAANPAIQDLLSRRLQDAAASPGTRLIALRAMAQAGLKEAPKAWLEGIASLLEGTDPDLLSQAVSTSHALPLAKAKDERLSAALLKIAGSEKVSPDIRLEALSAMPGVPAAVTAETFAFLREQLDPDGPVSRRSLASDVLSRARLAPEQYLALADALKATGPLEVNRLLAAFEQTSREDVGLRLIASLKESPAFATLRPEAIRPRLAKYDQSVQKAAEGLYALLNADVEKQKARLEGLLASVSGGDIRRGQAVFNGAKAACSSCHAIGYLGGKVGPDLTRIGQIRTERDLLESIVLPSASFVRSYEPVAVATKDGRVFNGVVRNDSSSELLLATGPNEEARLAKDDIEEIRPSTVSVMPAGLDQQLTTQELADLVAFLRACK